MKLSIILTVVFFCNSFVSMGQKTALSEVFKNSIEIYDKHDICLSKSDSIVSSSSFSFNNFKPLLSSKTEDSSHFKLYYRHDTIVCIERIDKLNVLYNYKFKVTYKNEFIYLSGYAGGDLLNGVIVINTSISNTYYLNICDDKINKNTLFYRTTYIMKLNDDLQPIYKLHFYNKYIDYLSDFHEEDSIIKEKIYLSIISCAITTDRIQTFSDFDKIFLRKECTYLFASVIPDMRDYSLPLWLYGDYRYK